MNRLLPLSVTVFALALAGCGQESDELPVDGRDFDGVEYGDTAPYGGKVIDGYLRNARVWLDVDGDSQYSPGPLIIELENGSQVTLASGEPTALTGSGGVFDLDVSELVVDPMVGPDLDPRDYPLYAVALPDVTVEEAPTGDAPVSNAFLMSAPPGVRNITPLTTLARYRALAGLFIDYTDAGVEGLNLLRDYLLSGDDRAHAYARALARFMASQLPQAYNDILAGPGADGTERYLSREAAFILGISLVQHAPEIIGIVDAAAQGDYASVDEDLLELPDIPLELSDPVLLTSVNVYGESERTGTLPANRSDLLISASLAFDYREDGRLISVSSDGCLAPSMPELARLIKVNGYMARLETQWLPAVALSPQSRITYEQAGVDERIVFDWDNRRIYFETSTTCHDHEGVVAGSSELGGNPEITYSWRMQDGALAELQAEISSPGGSSLIRTLAPETANADAGFPGYRVSEAGSDIESLVFSMPAAECVIDPEAVGAGQVVSASQGYQFAGYEPQPASFVDLALELDQRTFAYPGEGDSFVVNRILRYGFLDPGLSGLANVDADRGFEWALYYPPVGGAGFIDEFPGLISEAYLKKYSGARACGREFEDSPSAAYARVEYGYERLSDYLVGLLQ
ncbi:MAG: hypothetical protein EP328_11205 [Gammaproteobacteria bacterium]|nr:MAG: hypothetical protein EP328_11205 [Gammaproteobacteria bacterium]